jgi:hypothetical protein
MFIAIGAAGLWFGRSLEVGSAQEMGPGYAPIAISWGLLLLGVVALVKALLGGTAPIEQVSPRAVFGIIAALGVFAATIATLGLVAAAVLTVFAACLIEPKLRWVEVLLLSGGVSFVSIVLFVWVLRIPFQVWPV